MFSSGRLLSLYAETPVHCGSGASFGAIDLPIQREAHTNLPVLPSPSIKGVCKDAARDKGPKDPRIEEVFGPDNGSQHAGAISLTDGRLLLFPVRSSRGVFVWATCPFILQRLARDLFLLPGFSRTLDGLDALVRRDCRAMAPTRDALGLRIVLEDDDFDVDPMPEPARTALLALLDALVPGPEYAFVRGRVATHLIVLPDEDLVRLTTTATDVVTRNKLNDQKTTSGDGNMWVEEYVPSDALFYSIVLATASRKENGVLSGAATPRAAAEQVLDAALDLLAGVTHLQIGGDETVGRGWMRVNWIP